MPLDISFLFFYINNPDAYDLRSKPWYLYGDYRRHVVNVISQMGTNTLCRIAIMANIIRWVILYLTMNHNESSARVSLKSKILAAKIALVISSVIIVFFVTLWLNFDDDLRDIGIDFSFYIILPIMMTCYLIIFILIRSYYTNLIGKYNTLFNR